MKNKVIDKILKECKKQGIVNPAQIHYIIATVDYETNGTFLPVKEAYWLSEGWRKRNLRYYPYYGRGLVQITWKANYKKFSKLMDIDLVSNPDLALEIDNAVYILVYGFKHGVFTGKKISDYINLNRTDFKSARKVINGNDRAVYIAKLAQQVNLA